jgi:alanine-glyoxylate transaminase / (R)-3-amino-2-methylpropionate-pyruvate transaminase
MQSIEFSKNVETKEPNKELTSFIMEELKNNGILVGRGGLFGNVVRVGPPMCITAPDVEFYLYQLDKAIAKGI